MRVTYMISLNHGPAAKSSNLLHAYILAQISRNPTKTLTVPPYSSRKFGLALPTAWPNMPSADFCTRDQGALRRPQFRSRNAEQTSRGKFSRLPCAVAGSTLRVLDEYGLRD